MTSCKPKGDLVPDGGGRAHFLLMYFLYFLRRKCLDGRPRFLWNSSSSGDELDEGSLFSVSD